MILALNFNQERYENLAPGHYEGRYEFTTQVEFRYFILNITLYNSKLAVNYIAK